MPAVMVIEDEVVKFAAWVMQGLPADDLAVRRLAVFLQHVVNERRKLLVGELHVEGPVA